MSTVLVPWICEGAAAFLNNNSNNRKREESRIVQVLSNVEGTTSSFVVHDSQYHMAASFTDRAIGRYIKSGHELKHLVRSVISLDEWSFTVMNDKQVILVIDKVRHVMEGASGIVTVYLMQNGNVQSALQRYLGRASLPMCVVEEEESEYVGGETLEPGEWNYLESFYATQQQQPALVVEQFEESDYEVPPEQWDLIVEQMVGAGLTSSPTKGSPLKPTTLKVDSPVSDSSITGSPSKNRSSPVVVRRFDEEEDVLKLRPVSSSSPFKSDSQSSQSYLSSSSNQSSNQFLNHSPNQSYVSPTKKGKSSSLQQKKQKQPRFEVNMTPRRVLFEEEDDDDFEKVDEEDKITEQQEIEIPIVERKSGTPKRLRLYTDW